MPMISPDATPIAHHPPRRPISLRPVYPAEPREHWEEQIEEMARCAALSRGERLWAIVVEFARTPGFVPTTPPPDATHLTRGALNEVKASGIEDEAQNERAGFYSNEDGEIVWQPRIRDLGAEIGMPPLEDARNPTDEQPHEGVNFPPYADEYRQAVEV